METIQVRNESNEENTQESAIKRFFTVLIRTFVWVFVIAMILGGIAAAIWTVIPTEMLDWGSNQANLIGYVSHCSYTPVSTVILLVVSIIGILLTLTLKSSRSIGTGVFIGAAGGLGIGMIQGIDIVMFIGMGSGLGLGLLLGIIIGMTRGVKHSQVM